MDFKGKVVLITGASSGIGRSTAIYLSKLGAVLSLVGRNEDNLNSVVEECKTSSPEKLEPLRIVADVTIGNDVQKIVEQTTLKFGKIDVLINGAGIVANGTIETTSLEQYDKVMDSNVRSIYHLTMLAVPYLIKSKGNIVNISSVTGIRSFPNVLAYNMSKSAVDQFTRCTALELASKGVRVNSVNPGVIVTELHKRGGLNDKEYEQFLEHCKTTHALGRAGNVEEVAASIAFFASDLASFITGVQLPVDGGRHVMCPR